MQVHPVDPRDTRWEVDQPAYRVYFWEPQRPEDPHSMWVSDEWEIGDADVDEVLNWARGNAAGRRFVVYARIDTARPGEPGLVRLLGTDPLNELSGNISTSRTELPFQRRSKLTRMWLPTPPRGLTLSVHVPPARKTFDSCVVPTTWLSDHS